MSQYLHIEKGTQEDCHGLRTQRHRMTFHIFPYTPEHSHSKVAVSTAWRWGCWRSNDVRPTNANMLDRSWSTEDMGVVKDLQSCSVLAQAPQHPIGQYLLQPNGQGWTQSPLLGCPKEGLHQIFQTVWAGHKRSLHHQWWPAPTGSKFAQARCQVVKYG